MSKAARQHMRREADRKYLTSRDQYAAVQSINKDGTPNLDPQQVQEEQQPRFQDFQIVGKIIYLCKITNQLKQSQNVAIDLQLEENLLKFAKVFKMYILIDNRILMMCTNIY